MKRIDALVGDLTHPVRGPSDEQILELSDRLLQAVESARNVVSDGGWMDVTAAERHLTVRLRQGYAAREAVTLK